jgi:hypothetical protein
MALAVWCLASSRPTTAIPHGTGGLVPSARRLPILLALPGSPVLTLVCSQDAAIRYARLPVALNLFARIRLRPSGPQVAERSEHPLSLSHSLSSALACSSSPPVHRRRLPDCCEPPVPHPYRSGVHMHRDRCSSGAIYSFCRRRRPRLRFAPVHLRQDRCGRPYV